MIALIPTDPGLSLSKSQKNEQPTAARERPAQRSRRAFSSNLGYLLCPFAWPCFLHLDLPLANFFPESSLSLACLASAFSIPRWPFALAFVSACSRPVCDGLPRPWPWAAPDCFHRLHDLWEEFVRCPRTAHFSKRYSSRLRKATLSSVLIWIMEIRWGTLCPSI